MPNRILKESICTSDEIDRLSAFQETVFYRLIVSCDDYGRMDARPKILASKLFPLKDIRAAQIEDALRALTSAELVTLYEVDGKPFLQMKTWDRHQQIRAKKSKFPAPSGGMIAHDINCNQMISDDSKCPRNPIQSESNPNPNTNAKTHAREDDGFEEFWNAYPKKSGDIRTAYMEYIGAVDSGVEPSALLEAAQELADADEDEVRFAPSAEKWLRNKGWLQKPNVKANKPGAGKKTELDDEEQEDLERLMKKHWGAKDE